MKRLAKDVCRRRPAASFGSPRLRNGRGDLPLTVRAASLARHRAAITRRVRSLPTPMIRVRYGRSDYVSRRRNRAPTDRTRIDSKIPWHVTYWSKELECTEEQLRDL